MVKKTKQKKRITKGWNDEVEEEIKNKKRTLVKVLLYLMRTRQYVKDQRKEIEKGIVRKI